MARNTKVIPVAPLVRLLKDSGIERISDEAAKELADHLEEYARGIAKRSAELAAHAGRTTMLAEDVKLAKK